MLSNDLNYKTKRQQAKLTAVQGCTEKVRIFLYHPDGRETPCLASFRILLAHFPVYIVIRDLPNTFFIFHGALKTQTSLTTSL